MRPVRPTPAHQTDRLAELVCSNSLKSESESTAPWLLKEELRRLRFAAASRCAQTARVPGGHALTVDRDVFAAEVTAAIAAEPRIELRREEVTALPERRICDRRHRASYQRRARRRDRAAHRLRRASSSTTASARSSTPRRVDTSIAFWASRYGKSTDGTDDYLNCPFDREQYERFVDELLKAAERHRRISPRTTRRTSKPACRSRRSRAAAATRCASAR